jgi:hypothetical protein
MFSLFRYKVKKMSSSVLEIWYFLFPNPRLQKAHIVGDRKCGQKVFPWLHGPEEKAKSWEPAELCFYLWLSLD